MAGIVTKREVVSKMRLERYAGPDYWELCGCGKDLVIQRQRKVYKDNSCHYGELTSTDKRENWILSLGVYPMQMGQIVLHFVDEEREVK